MGEVGGGVRVVVVAGVRVVVAGVREVAAVAAVAAVGVAGAGGARGWAGVRFVGARGPWSVVHGLWVAGWGVGPRVRRVRPLGSSLQEVAGVRRGRRMRYAARPPAAKRATRETAVPSQVAPSHCAPK